MKYNVQVSGHALSLDLDRKDDGTFTANVSGDEGSGLLTGTWSGNNFQSAGNLKGHDVKITGQTIGNNISGTVKVRVSIFWIPADFTGIAAT